jgi:hypothetical protein
MTLPGVYSPAGIAHGLLGTCDLPGHRKMGCFIEGRKEMQCRGKSLLIPTLILGKFICCNKPEI